MVLLLGSSTLVMQHLKWVNTRTVKFQLDIRQQGRVTISCVGPRTIPIMMLGSTIMMLENIGESIIKTLFALQEQSTHGSVR